MRRVMLFTYSVSIQKLSCNLSAYRFLSEFKIAMFIKKYKYEVQWKAISFWKNLRNKFRNISANANFSLIIFQSIVKFLSHRYFCSVSMIIDWHLYRSDDQSPV